MASNIFWFCGGVKFGSFEEAVQRPPRRNVIFKNFVHPDGRIECIGYGWYSTKTTSEWDPQDSNADLYLDSVEVEIWGKTPLRRDNPVVLSRKEGWTFGPYPNWQYASKEEIEAFASANKKLIERRTVLDLIKQGYITAGEVLPAAWTAKSA